ncbi:hypothetical protein R1sor_020466 [Riccia sorocarpa]|uniref:DUF7869 domain-containing protein n=1 Tax=Riccia sorocarpa TaxID=122646 RepID=A0ABD3IH48_9MARC
MSGRTNYYTHNKLAMDEPLLYKSAIHDGMDSAKTSLPRTVNYVKALVGVGAPMPLKLAGILNRGDGPPVFAHDIFEKTVLAPKHQTAAQFFNMDDEVANSQDRPFRKLPSTFYIQLDNSGKDNKNWAVMSFLSISKPVAFKFYMEDNMPMFQFQDKYRDSWSQGNSLWRRKDRKSKTDFSLVLPPDQEPLSAPMNRTHDNKEEIVSYLTAYIAHIGEIQAKTSTSNESYALDQAIIDYWKNIKSVFEGKAWETYEGRPLKNGF